MVGINNRNNLTILIPLKALDLKEEHVTIPSKKRNETLNKFSQSLVGCIRSELHQALQYFADLVAKEG